ncbi:MAG: VCBS repeat-containing protein, partial [Sphingomonadales bacterium]
MNTPPTGADSVCTIAEDEAYALTLDDVGFVDSDGDDLAAVTIVTLPTRGTLIYDNDGDSGTPPSLVQPGDTIVVADIIAGRLVFTPYPDDNGTGNDSLTFLVQDNGGIDDGGSDIAETPNTLTFDVAPVNDAPSGTDTTISLEEDATYVLTLADFGLVDTDGDDLIAVTIETTTSLGTLSYDPDGPGGLDAEVVVDGQTFSAAAIAAGQLAFTPYPDENGAAYDSLIFRVQDDGGIDNGGNDTATSTNTLTFDVAAVNDAPALDLDFFDIAAPGVDAAARFLEGGGAIALAPGAFVSDEDSTDFDGGLLTISLNGGSTDDQLTIADIGVQPGEIGVDGQDVTYGGIVFGTWSGGNSGNDLVITFNADACACAVQLLAANILYASSANLTAPDTRGVTFTLVDGDAGDDTATAQVALDLVPVNTAPTGTDNSVTLDEDSDYVLALADFGFSDGDGDALLSVTIDTLPSLGTLSYDADGAGGDEPTFVSAGDTISAADIAAGLLVFTPYPDENGTSYDSLTFYVQDDGGTDDGGSDTSSAVNTVTFDVTPVNDTPFLDLDFLDVSASGVDAALTYREGEMPTALAPYAFAADVEEDFGGGSLTIEIAGATPDDQLTINSIGDDSGEIALDGEDVTYEGVVIGTWSGGANGAPLVILFNEDACTCAVETIAANIFYANSAADITAASTRTITFTLDDGSPEVGTSSTSAQVTLDILPSNSAPVIALPAPIAGDEDSPIGIGGISVSDAGSDPAIDLVTVRLAVANGTLTLRTDIAGGIAAGEIARGNGSAMITIIATLDQINTTLAVADGLSYLGNADFFGSESLDISVFDGSPADAIDLSSGGVLSGPSGPSAALITDIDGDGSSELVFGNYYDSTAVLVAGATMGVAVEMGSVVELVAADLDGDGVQEVIVADYGELGGDGAVRIISLTGGANYTMTVIADVAYASAVAVADFDGDGLLDIVAADADAGRVAVLLQANAYSAEFYAASDFVVDVAAGDVNGDGFADLVVAGDDGLGDDSLIQLLLGNGDGTFRSATELFASPLAVASLTLSDLDGDGLLDIAFSAQPCGCVPGEEAGVYVMLGTAGGAFAVPDFYATSADGTTGSIAAGDINGDGIADLIVANADLPGTLSILVGNGDGSFQGAQQVGTGGFGPVGFGMGDLDMDGDADLLVGNLYDDTLSLLINNAWGRGTRSSLTITVNAVDDPGVAHDDIAATAENATVSI